MATLQFRLATEVKVLLEAERSRLRASLGWLGEAEQTLGESQGEESSAGGQEADVASDIAEQTLDLTLERSERRRLEEVEEALERLAKGTYGVCANCHQPIDPSRLTAIPWTRWCHDCAARHQA